MMRYNPKALRRIRVTKRLPIERVASQSRMSLRQLFQLESGRSEPRASTLARLASALGVSVARFFDTADGRGR